MGNAIKGALFGGLMFIAAFPLLWWNEGRAVKTEQALEEGQASVITVPSASVDPANNGKLVHLNGGAKTDETLTDPEFGISINAIKLERHVEMYQWDEDKKDNTYTYKMVWDNDVIDSEKFHDRSRVNPKQMLYKRQERKAARVTIGAFTVSGGMVDRMDEYQKLPAEGAKLPPNGKVAADGVIFIGANPASPGIGDHRVWFEVVKAGDYSVAGRQNASGLEAYPTKAGEPVELCYPGIKTSQQIFQQAIAENTMLTWILRFVGLIVMTFGLLMVLSPIQKVANFVPFLGDVVGFVLFLACGLISLALSLVTIGIAWLAYRPLLGGGLLAAALAAIILVVMMRKKKGPTPQAAQ